MLIHPANASSDFQTLFERFPGTRLACPEDSRALTNFFNSTAMNADGFNFAFTRGEDYFALPNLQSERSATLICEENNSIVGVGAVSMRKGFVRGKIKPIGYLQDLRLAPAASARTRQSLYGLFCEFVRICPNLPDFENCAVFLTAILNDNSAARNALSRPSFPLEYTRLSQYQAYIWPKIPSVAGFLSKARTNEDTHWKLITDFYESQLGKMAFDLTIEDILRFQSHAVPVVIETNGEIQAACLLVDTTRERRICAQYSPLGWSIDSSGTYITALRVKRSLSAAQRITFERLLMSKALRFSNRLPGNFTGFIETENSLQSTPSWRARLRFSISGALYRVFHQEHTKLDDFHAGFLRPAHSSAFEWVMS